MKTDFKRVELEVCDVNYEIDFEYEPAQEATLLDPGYPEEAYISDILATDAVSCDGMDDLEEDILLLLEDAAIAYARDYNNC